MKVGRRQVGGLSFRALPVAPSMRGARNWQSALSVDFPAAVPD
jgi:hypothetical protein